MSNETNARYPVLNQLSTVELEDLLAQDFVTSNGKGPDIDFILAIMEVIESMDTEEEKQRAAVNTDAAWDDFQCEYQGNSCSFGLDDFRKHDSSHLNKIKKSRKRYHIFRYLGISAVLIVLMSTLTSALGINLFQVFTGWTSEMFSFISTDSAGQPAGVDPAQEDPFCSLRKAVAERTDVLVIPTLAPDKLVSKSLSVNS